MEEQQLQKTCSVKSLVTVHTRLAATSVTLTTVKERNRAKLRCLAPQPKLPVPDLSAVSVDMLRVASQLAISKVGVVTTFKITFVDVVILILITIVGVVAAVQNT